MNIILWLLLGMLAGYLARILVGQKGGKWWQDVLIGALGAVVGGCIAMMLGLGPITGFNLYSLLIAILGACLLLLLLSWLRSRLN